MKLKFVVNDDLVPCLVCHPEDSDDCVFLRSIISENQLDSEVGLAESLFDKNLIFDLGNLFAQMKFLGLYEALQDAPEPIKPEPDANIRPGPLSGGDASGLSTPD